MSDTTSSNPTLSVRPSTSRLSRLTMVGFGAGDLAQNLIYQTVSMYLLFFYTNVYGLAPSVAAVMFLIVRIIDVIWDPVVGTYIDKHNPRWGKYRSYLVIGGIPLTGFAILCFWTGFSGSLAYAYITYVGLSMCYTLVNVPYGALNASLSRDAHEVTVLTSTRMFMANLGGLAVGMGVPVILKCFAGDSASDAALASSPSAWLTTMTIYGIAGLGLLLFCFTQCRERVVMDASATADVKVSDLWHEFVSNRPLRVIALFFITAFAMMAIGNAAGSYFIQYNMGGTDYELSVFMGLGSLPAFIFMPMVPWIKRLVGKKRMFYIFLSVAVAGMALLYIIARMPSFQGKMELIYVAQFIKSTGVIIATGYMWVLVPEVITYAEYVHGRRISGIVNALTGIFYKAGMALGGVIPGLVLAYVGFSSKFVSQTPAATEGILWLVAVIPAMLLVLAMFIISRYEISDEKLNEMNRIINKRKNCEDN